MLVCENCGSDKVQSKFWINPNTKNIIDSAVFSTEDNWCEECEEHVNLIKKEQENE